MHDVFVGVRVNVVKQEHESQRGQVRVTLPGGRQLESVLGKGSVAIGARTMQEGGAFGTWIREQVPQLRRAVHGRVRANLAGRMKAFGREGWGVGLTIYYVLP